MNYKIKHKDKIIAAFVYQSDRDVCLDALSEEHSDETFEAMEVGK